MKLFIPLISLMSALVVGCSHSSDSSPSSGALTEKDSRRGGHASSYQNEVVLETPESLQNYFGPKVGVELMDENGNRPSYVIGQISDTQNDLKSSIAQAINLAIANRTTVVLVGKPGCGFGLKDSPFEQRLSKNSSRYYSWLLTHSGEQYVWACGTPLDASLVNSFEDLLSISDPQLFDASVRNWNPGNL